MVYTGIQWDITKQPRFKNHQFTWMCIQRIEVVSNPYYIYNGDAPPFSLSIPRCIPIIQIVHPIIASCLVHP